MNFKSIEYFLTVERTKSITKAASLLHITQQTLSADIAALERELGQPLFIRKIPLQLTYAGETFCKYAREIQQSHQAMLQAFCDLSENQAGVLRVGVTFTRGQVLMPPLIELFQQRYPHISVELLEDSNDRLQKHLTEGDVDLSILGFPHEHPDLTLIPYYQEQWVLLAAPSLLDHVFGAEKEQVLQNLRSGDFSALSQCPFVLGIPDDIGGNLAQRFFKQQRLQPSVMARSENLDTLLSLCARGVGACFAPTYLIPSALSNLEAISLPDAAYQIYFAYQKTVYHWKLIDQFIELAQTLEKEQRHMLERSGSGARDGKD